MAWTTPATAAAGTPLSATWLNTYLRDNMLYVHSGKPVYNYRGIAGDIASGSASIVDIDSVNMSRSISTTTGRIFVCAAASLTTGTSHTISIGIDIDGTLWDWRQILVTGAQWTNWATAIIVPGLSIGSHTVKLRWAPNGIATTYGNSSSWPSNFSVMEV